MTFQVVIFAVYSLEVPRLPNVPGLLPCQITPHDAQNKNNRRKTEHNGLQMTYDLSLLVDELLQELLSLRRWRFSHSVTPKEKKPPNATGTKGGHWYTAYQA